MRVDIGFSNQVTFIPKRLHVELAAIERPVQNGKSYPRKQYTAVHANDDCQGYPFVFPNIFTPTDEKRVI